MNHSIKIATLLAAGGLAACAVAPPTGPSITSMPGAGKNFDQFVADDAVCRQYAQARMPAGSAQAAQQNAAGTAVAGTALGAAAGALIGAGSGNAGAGAAIGAGTGLVAGSAVAANNAAYGSDNLQRDYDVAYAQCMAGKGEKVPDMTATPAVAARGYYYEPYYGYWGYPYPGYYGPDVYFSYGFGGGGRRWR